MAKPTSVTDTNAFSIYKKICREAATDNHVFNTFRSMPKYTYVVDNLGKNLGHGFIEVIKEYLGDISFTEFTDKFKFNDIIGTPTVYDYGEYGKWTPVTLRYIKTILMLKDLFGDLHDMKIAEIGGGYGGQAAILMSEFNIDHYLIFDLHEVVGLQSRYLDTHQLFNYQTVNPTQLNSISPLSPDVVISDFAFSEMSSETQELYFEKVIKNSRMGHMALNFQSAHGIDSWSLEKYKDKFNSIGKNIDVVPDKTLAHVASRILLWGFDENNQNK